VNKPKPKPDDPKQSRRFIDAAKAAGVDESGQAFERAIGRLAPEKRPITKADPTRSDA
jgi:hypothetical protein